MCALSNINKMAYFYAACAVRVTIFSTGGNSALFCYTLLLKSLVLMYSWLKSKVQHVEDKVCSGLKNKYTIIHLCFQIP